MVSWACCGGFCMPHPCGPRNTRVQVHAVLPGPCECEGKRVCVYKAMCV